MRHLQLQLVLFPSSARLHYKILHNNNDTSYKIMTVIMDIYPHRSTSCSRWEQIKSRLVIQFVINGEEEGGGGGGGEEEKKEEKKKKKKTGTMYTKTYMCL